MSDELRQEIHELNRRANGLDRDVEDLVTLGEIQRRKIQTLEKKMEALLECFPDLDTDDGFPGEV